MWTIIQLLKGIGLYEFRIVTAAVELLNNFYHSDDKFSAITVTYLTGAIYDIWWQSEGVIARPLVIDCWSVGSIVIKCLIVWPQLALIISIQLRIQKY